MSCNEWEHGEIKLPTDQVTMVKDAVKAAATQHCQRLYDESQAFWKALPSGHKRDPEKYSRAVRAFCYSNQDEQWNEATRRYERVQLDTKLPAWPGFGDDCGRNTFVDDLNTLLSWRCTYRLVEGGGYKQNSPRRAQRPDVDAVVGKTTGANPSFRCGEASLSFEGRVAVWTVGENNHARDFGRNHPVAQAFFSALRRVRWTRGSGGEIVGNDEYNQDSRDSGGGGNYTIDKYGPEKASSRRPVAARRW